MWLGGTVLWTSLLWASALVLTVWIARTSRFRLLVAGGMVLIVVLGMSTVGVGSWTFKSPWMTVPLPGEQVIQVRAVDFAFRPSVVAASPGGPLTLELINSGALEHIVMIPVLGVRATLLPGERRMVHVGRVAAGTYEFFCDIPAHRDAGMIGRLVVGPEN